LVTSNFILNLFVYTHINIEKIQKDYLLEN